LGSNIFNYTFDFDGWPGAHANKDFCLRPYNESIFVLRHHYKTVFQEKEFDVAVQEEHRGMDTSKVYKIKYNLNLLPSLSEYVALDEQQRKTIKNEGVSMMSLVQKTGELAVFDTEALAQLIEFKWVVYAKGPHLMTFAMVTLYSLVLMLYVNFVYLLEGSSLGAPLELVLLIALLYPLGVNCLKIYKYGPKRYFQTRANYIDLVFNINAFINFIL
jgi:hypothetical protein